MDISFIDKAKILRMFASRCWIVKLCPSLFLAILSCVKSCFMIWWFRIVINASLFCWALGKITSRLTRFILCKWSLSTDLSKHLLALSISYWLFSLLLNLCFSLMVILTRYVWNHYHLPHLLSQMSEYILACLMLVSRYGSTFLSFWRFRIVNYCFFSPRAGS